MATVGRLMAELGIEGARGRAKTITTRPDRHGRKSVDLVKRNFTVHEVDTLWVSDLTYIGTKEGWLYLVCIMDACSRRILGHAMGETMDTELFINAFNPAKDLRGMIDAVATTVRHHEEQILHLKHAFEDRTHDSRPANSSGAGLVG
ncbi:DDE-type integrase/transposase/recombinase [Ferrimicrobium acidiphilum]|uniref:DDE-type integrase/transposase/recombinase n=1 Tax=Ferrimicrobium acidiphilum TaxID=121039 RepID=UPI0023F57D1F|nr:DDE-type integrase/transposase/recombinase [Ferrimicrobium acidiphilum]